MNEDRVMTDGKITAAEKKRVDALDRRIEKLQDKISEKRREYDALTGELQELMDERHPERKEERVKGQLYNAYLHSRRSLEEILEFMEGRDDEIDW